MTMYKNYFLFDWAHTTARKEEEEEEEEEKIEVWEEKRFSKEMMVPAEKHRKSFHMPANDIDYTLQFDYPQVMISLIQHAAAVKLSINCCSQQKSASSYRRFFSFSFPLLSQCYLTWVTMKMFLQKKKNIFFSIHFLSCVLSLKIKIH